jgi:hypothetical protein
MPDTGASPSSAAKKKAPPLPKKEQKRPYMSVEIAQALNDQNTSMGLRNVHLPDGWYLNVRRVSVLPRRGWERRDEIWCWRDQIRRRLAILPPDLHEDLTFIVESEWWDRPTYKPCLRRRSSLLSDEEYDYSLLVNAPQQVSWAPPAPEEEESKEMAILIEDYQPPDLSKEEAIQRAMEESGLLELGLWDRLGMQL